MFRIPARFESTLATARKARAFASASLALVALGLFAPARAEVVRLEVRPVQPVLVASNAPQRTTIQISLEGIAPVTTTERKAPLNLALVLDRSGSMSGEKMQNARLAALEILERMGPRDVLSVVAYDDNVQVVIPAAPVLDRSALRARILGLREGGMTALFGGVSKGLAEARKFKGEGRSTRLILVSDGQANVGPSSVSELAALGRSAAKEGVPVSTVGLGEGYNEDLMQQLAQASDGNHDFAERGSDLARIFDREFGDAQEIVATDLVVKFRCPEGVRPIRVLDRDAEIRGQELSIRWNQLSGGQRKILLVEVEVPAGKDGAKTGVGEVSAVVKDRATGATATASSRADISYSGNQVVAVASLDKKTKAAVVRATANENLKRAIQMRDAGKPAEAKAILKGNASLLGEAAGELGDASLREEAAAVEKSADQVEDASSWSKERKVLRSKQHKVTTQSKE